MPDQFATLAAQATLEGAAMAAQGAATSFWRKAGSRWGQWLSFTSGALLMFAGTSGSRIYLTVGGAFLATGIALRAIAIWREVRIATR